MQIITCVREQDEADEMLATFPEPLFVFRAVGFKSMGEGYNSALDHLSGDLMMFVHSDVRYWGSESLLSDAALIALREDTGFVGVAGRSGPLDGTAMWWNDPGPIQCLLRGSVAHDNLHGGALQTTGYGPYGPVQVLDGVLLMCHRRVFDKIGRWDESLGWHFYDLDITLRAHKAGLKNYAVPLPILHKGLGALTPEWEASRKMFLEKHGI